MAMCTFQLRSFEPYMTLNLKSHPTYISQFGNRLSKKDCYPDYHYKYLFFFLQYFFLFSKMYKTFIDFILFIHLMCYSLTTMHKTTYTCIRYVQFSKAFFIFWDLESLRLIKIIRIVVNKHVFYNLHY